MAKAYKQWDYHGFAMYIKESCKHMKRAITHLNVTSLLIIKIIMTVLNDMKNLATEYFTPQNMTLKQAEMH